MECDGIAKKYIQVSKNDKEKSDSIDERKQLQRQMSQQANDMIGMSNCRKRNNESKEKNRSKS